MNLLLLPMWMLSGAFFPASGAPAWLRWVMAVNPMTYALAGLRRGMYWGGDVDHALPQGTPGFGLAVGVSLFFAAVTFAVAVQQARRTTSGDLQ